MLVGFSQLFVGCKPQTASFLIYLTQGDLAIGLQIFRVYAMYHSSRMILFTLAGFATLMSAVTAVSNQIVALSARKWNTGPHTPIQRSSSSICGQWAISMVWKTKTPLLQTVLLNNPSVGCRVGTTDVQ